MSAHHLTIAKASFAAGLLRPDVTKIGRDDLTTFHTLLDAAVTTCTAHNIQKCREWIAANIAPSAARTAALGKYLSSLSKHTHQESRNDRNGKSTSASRKKLHLLYVLHDVAHHSKYHTPNLSTFSTFTASVQPFLVELAHSTASEQRPKILFRLYNLFEVWEAEKYWSKDYVNKLRQATSELNPSEQAAAVSNAMRQPSQGERDEAGFMIPATHGDPSTPYYDLPAGNLLPFLEAGSSASIRPEQIRPLQFTAGQADKPLVNALKDFLKDVESIEHRYSIPEGDVGTSEIDELGQITTRDEAGDIIGDTYYGWSRAFCEKMKRRRRGVDGGRDRRRSPSRGSSRSSSRSPRKRRRYDDSDRSRSPSRSTSPPRFRAASPARASNEQSHRQAPQAPRSFASGPQFGPPPPPPAAIPILPPNPALFHAPPLGPNGLPIPPPQPPNWNRPWPPPPPPSGVPFPRGSTFQPPPPPPPGYPGTYGNNYR